MTCCFGGCGAKCLVKSGRFMVCVGVVVLVGVMPMEGFEGGFVWVGVCV